MSFYLENIILHNRAPFEHISLDFSDKQVTVLNAVNGGGKTTIMSYIVDAFHEIAKDLFEYEYENKRDKYYRLASPIYNLKPGFFSIVYIRFKCNGQNVDFLDVSGYMSKDEYEKIIYFSDKVPYEHLGNLQEEKFLKKYFFNGDINVLKTIFSDNVVTYFPAYRFESPRYLNKLFQQDVGIKIKNNYLGYMTNPIEVISDVNEIANWILDVILDSEIESTEYKIYHNNIIEALNPIVNSAISNKKNGEGIYRLGIGRRNESNIRISVVKENFKEISTFYPSLFDMSSGELSIIAIFAEILRQADRLHINTALQNITGIVLIDEIDKHLHITMQEKQLKNLFNLFPNVQFITSSHSPFVSIGLVEEEGFHSRFNIVDLYKNGASINPYSLSEYRELANAIKKDKENISNMHRIIEELSNLDKLIIISEGNNIKHINKAIQVLAPDLINQIYFEERIMSSSGKEQLKKLYRDYSKPTNSKFLFVWDCDTNGINELKSNNHNFYKYIFPKNNTNRKIESGIENLYSENLFSKKLYNKITNNYDKKGNILNTKYDIRKTEFLDLINSKNNKIIFKNFNTLVKRIRDLI